MTFEQAYEKLEEISSKLSIPDIALDQAIALFEESIKLTKMCYDMLKQTEGKILVYKKELENLAPLDVE